MTDFVAPGLPGSKVTYLSRYDHWINGKFVKPSSGQYFENVTPVTGKVFCDVARGNAADIDLALDAAHAAAPAWGRTSATERAIILNKIADRMEANVEAIAVAETWNDCDESPDNDSSTDNFVFVTNLPLLGSRTAYDTRNRLCITSTSN